MRVQTIFPVSHLSDLLIAILVVFVAIWTTRIVNVIPILSEGRRSRVFLALLSATTRPLFTDIVVIGVLII